MFREREKKVFHLLFHPPNATNNSTWARLSQKLKFHLVLLGKQRDLQDLWHHPLRLGCISWKLDWKRSNWDSNWHCDDGMQASEVMHSLCQKYSHIKLSSSRADKKRDHWTWERYGLASMDISILNSEHLTAPRQQTRLLCHMDRLACLLSAF